MLTINCQASSPSPEIIKAPDSNSLTSPTSSFGTLIDGPSIERKSSATMKSIRNEVSAPSRTQSAIQESDDYSAALFYAAESDCSWQFDDVEGEATFTTSSSYADSVFSLDV